MRYRTFHCIHKVGTFNLTVLSHSYTPSKWLEREDAMQIVKVIRTYETPALLHLTFLKERVPEIKDIRGDFFNIVLEVPASVPRGYYPLYTPPLPLPSTRLI